MKTRRLQQERMKAKDAIGLPEARREPAEFDPDVDITEDDWNGIRECLGDLRWNLETEKIPDLVVGIHLISPERARQYEITDQEWALAFEEVEAERRHAQEKKEFRNIRPLVGLLNDRGFIERDPVSFEAAKDAFKKAKDFRSMAPLANALILVPEMGKLMDLTGRDWAYLRGKLDKYRAQQNWSRFLEYAAKMTLLVSDGIEWDENGRPTAKRKEDTSMDEGQPLPQRSAVA